MCRGQVGDQWVYFEGQLSDDESDDDDDDEDEEFTAGFPPKSTVRAIY